MRMPFTRIHWLRMISAAVFLFACCPMSQFNGVLNTARQYEEKGEFKKALREYQAAKSICSNQGNIDADIRRVNGKIEAHQYYLEGQQAAYKNQKTLACDYFHKAYELWPGHPRLKTKIKRCRRGRSKTGTAYLQKQAIISKSGPPVIHEVRSGDSLSGIITDYYGEYKRLITPIKIYNRIEGGLQVGKKIKLPSMSIPGEGIIHPKQQSAPVKKEAVKPASPARPAASPPAVKPLSGQKPAAEADTCKTFLDQAHKQFRAKHYPQALELFEAAEACSDGCQECRKYIFYVEGVLLGQKGLPEEADDQLEDALEYDPNDRFQPSNQVILALKKQLTVKQFETFQSDFSKALARYKKVRQYGNVQELFNTGNYIDVMKWIDDSSSNGLREIKTIQEIRAEAGACSQCREYEMSVKQRLYREAVSHDQAERPMQAFIAWDTLNAIDSTYKDVRQKKNDAKMILKKLLPLM